MVYNLKGCDVSACRLNSASGIMTFRLNLIKINRKGLYFQHFEPVCHSVSHPESLNRDILVIGCLFAMLQARLPEYQPNVRPEDMSELCEPREDLKWKPSSVMDGDLIMFLRAAR